MKMNKKGFTLIELLAVIVILAIIALIATPIVMNIINDSQKAADARSVESFVSQMEKTFYQKYTTNGGSNYYDGTTVEGVVRNYSQLETDTKDSMSGNKTIKCDGISIGTDAIVYAATVTCGTDGISTTGCTRGNDGAFTCQ